MQCDMRRRVPGRCLGHEGGALTNEISPYKRGPQSSLALWAMGGICLPVFEGDHWPPVSWSLMVQGGESAFWVWRVPHSWEPGVFHLLGSLGHPHVQVYGVSWTAVSLPGLSELGL